MRIVFMGTPDFAVGSLAALSESGKYDIVGVITQPDRLLILNQKGKISPTAYR